MEVPRRAGGIVAEGAAAPGAKNQPHVTDSAGDSPHSADAGLHQVGGDVMPQFGGVGAATSPGDFKTFRPMRASPTLRNRWHEGKSEAKLCNQLNCRN